MLHRLINKKSLTVLGLNSGTSADAVDCAVIRVKRGKSGLTAKYLYGKSYRLNSDLQEAVLSFADDASPALETAMALDIQLGIAYGKIAGKLLKQLTTKKIKPDIIASHGQTIRHLPNQIHSGKKQYSATCQIGAADAIASATGKIVVHDFRQAAVGVGGEGAPITGGATYLLVNSNKPTCVVNIGGMSNFFYWTGKKSNKNVEVHDCGPGNVLSDLLMKKLYNNPYDRNGAVARKGTVSKRLLSLLLSHPFFIGKTVSTGREAFGEEIVRQMLEFKEKFSLPPEDILTTASELTVQAIKQQITRLVKKAPAIKKLYLTGGGRKNIFFKKRLQAEFPDLAITAIDTTGINGDFVEASAYAVMGAAALWGMPLQNVNRQQIICGTISQPPKV